MPELSPPFRDLLKSCATCGGPMPCVLHDEQMREVILRPPEERRGLPWEKAERQDLGKHNGPLYTIAPLDGTCVLVSDIRGHIIKFDPTKPEGNREEIIEGYGSIAFSISRLPDGTYLVSGESGVLKRMDLAQPIGKRAVENLDVYMRGMENTSILQHEVLPDGSVILFTSGATFLNFIPSKPEGERFARMGSLRHTTYAFTASSPSENKDVLFVRPGGDIMKFDPTKPSGEHEEHLASITETARAFVRLGDGTFLIGAESGRITRFDPRRPESERLEDIANFGELIMSMTLESDTSLLVCGSDGTIARYTIPDAALRAHHERKLDTPAVPPMPDA